MFEGEADKLQKAHGEAGEPFIEPDEEGKRLLVRVLKKNRAERGREGQRDEARNHDGDGNRHRKLSIEFAGNAAQECHRDEDRGENEHDGDERAGNLLHRLDGGVEGRELFCTHQAFDVLEHHDGVVDHDADGERHRKERERIERKAEKPEAGHGADERHRNGEHGDQRGAPALKEEEDHDENEKAGLGKRVVDLIEGCADEDGGVVCDHVGELALREFLSEFGNPRLDFSGCRHGVGARLQINADIDAGLAVHVDAEFIASLAGLGGGDVSQAHEPVSGVALNGDFAEFLRREKLPRR